MPAKRKHKPLSQHVGEINPRTGQSKVSQYGWTVKDKPGEFALINKRELHVDESYQRAHKKTRVLKLSAEWSWIACGAISVALRDPGEWWVMDGQHRVLAAQQRDDIQELPCMVFDVESTAQEAQGFLDSNINRKPMTMVDRFNALLATGDHAAQVVAELVAKAHLRVDSGPSSHVVNCVGALLQCCAEDEMRFRRIWAVAVEVCEGEKIHQTLIYGMFYLESHIPDQSLSDNRWRKRLRQIGPADLSRAIAQSAAYHGGSRSNVNAALGIANAINKGLRHQLEHTITKGKK